MFFKGKKRIIRRLTEENSNLLSQKIKQDEKIKGMKLQEIYFNNLKLIVNKYLSKRRVKIKEISTMNGKDYLMIIEQKESLYKGININVLGIENEFDYLGELSLEFKEDNKAYLLSVESKLKGVGSLLLKESIIYCNENDIKVIYGDIWDKKNEELNLKLFYFYEKNGFEVNKEKFTFKKEL